MTKDDEGSKSKAKYKILPEWIKHIESQTTKDIRALEKKINEQATNFNKEQQKSSVRHKLEL